MPQLIHPEESISIAELDLQLVQTEREIFTERFKIANHPEAMIDKLVAGRINKFYQEVVLLEQNFVMNNKKKISELINEAATQLGFAITLTSFIRYELGEGLIAQEKKNFADEVAAISGSN